MPTIFVVLMPTSIPMMMPIFFFRIYGYGVQSYNYYWKKQIYYVRMLLFVFSMHIPFLLSYIGTAIVVGVVVDAPLGIY